ncbi:hypothetical protein [Bacillus thuringiensis]|jgi:hypothetical protein|uniref:hypothetical protein n=1 Tax=Bacillus thuringiensis TaxID=1428 RepID=UPI000BFBD466|nr:hypothetical protein [Bacillus thuringiensis]PGM56023.1 hypothetical protein CN949_01680 [Bacillus thuringiensis]
MTGNDFIENLTNLFRLLRTDNILQTTVTTQPITVTGVDRILDVFNEISTITEDKFTIYYKDHENNDVAEVAVLMDRIFRVQRDERTPKVIEDDNNQIKYEMGKEISDRYIVWLFKNIFEKFPNLEGQPRIRMLLSNRSRSVLRGGPRFGTPTDVEEISLLDIMRNVVDCGTLKITKLETSRINLEEAIDSFSYAYMCNMNTPIKIYSIEEAMGISKRRQRETNHDFQAPKRKYNSNLIDYYNLAVSSEDPFVSFISYYHIIEYFFDEVYREQQINTLKTSITATRFNYKDDEQLFNIIDKILKDNKSVRENGSGNEHQSLNYVLNKYINNLDDFKQGLSSEELNFYQNNIVSFSKGNIIKWGNDRDKVLKAISNRIYKTRNALIHSKSSKKDMTYHPYLHKTELEKEINLIKSIAECIIENSSVLIGS